MILRHEINLINAPLVQTSTTGFAPANEQAVVDFTKYSGTTTCYLEILYTNTATSTGTARPFGTSQFPATLSANTTTPTLARGNSFTISGSQTFNLSVGGLSSAGTATIKAARIIVIQDTGSNLLTDTQALFEIGSNEAGFASTSLTASSKPKYWKYDATKWDGTCSFSWQICLTSGSTMVTMTYALQTSSDLSNWTTVGSSFTDVSVGAQLVSNLSFTPVDGNYYRIAAMSGSTKTTVNLYCAKVVVIQTSATEITKGQEQHLMANNTLASGTALQSFLTKWDSSEWSGVDNTYIHQTDSNNTSMTAEIDTAAGVQVTGSQVTGTALVKQSAAMTMPANGNLDVKATTNSGAIYASRIIVSWSKTTAPPATYTPYSFCFIV